MATAHAPMARVPFAPIDNPRLQHLASAKNRQNGLFTHKSSTTDAKSSSNSMKSGHISITTATTSSHKRAHDSSTYDDDCDSENVDPAMFDSPSKKIKGSMFAHSTTKPFTYSSGSSHHTPARISMPPPSSSTFSSPRSSHTPLRANMSSPRAPMTAPAGRSPQRKRAGLKSTRRTSAPFSRVNPPSFHSTSAFALPFSLDAALSSSLPGSTPASTPTPNMSGATIAESMPKTWLFEIYEDSPEEEAANLMEHSTLILDLSSDDEDGKKVDDYRGKENTPPEGYDAPTASRSSSSTTPLPVLGSKKDIVRKKVVKDEMDDGSRSPLSDLETEDFYAEGLTKDSFVLVDEVVEEPAAALTDAKEVVYGAVTAKVVTAVDKDEIVIWQDKDAV